MTEHMTEAELADHYERTRDTSDFDLGRSELITVKRNATMSVPFSPEDIEEQQRRADTSGRANQAI